MEPRPRYLILQQGHNIVIDEFAHKLDMLSGQADGQPPLTNDMSLEKWSDSLTSPHCSAKLNISTILILIAMQPPIPPSFLR